MNIDHYKELFGNMKKRAERTKENARGQALKLIAGLKNKGPHQRAAEFAQTAFNIVFDGKKTEPGAHPGTEDANTPGNEQNVEIVREPDQNDVMKDIQEAILNNTLCIDRLEKMHEELLEALKEIGNPAPSRKAGRPSKMEEKKRQEELRENAEA
jgi:hypothetical protein